MTASIIVGNALHALGQFETGSVQTCVTSPPYWGLRDYGDPGQEWPVVEFELRLGGLDVPASVPAMIAPLGLEKTPIAYVAHLVAIFREVWRTLADDGTLFVNIGDTYSAHQGIHARIDGSTAHKQRGTTTGMKPKDLVGIPWLLAYALRSDGWYLRSDIIWHKRNPMPESVRDRPTKGHEYLFMLAKSAQYLARMDAVKEPAKDWGIKQRAHTQCNQGRPTGTAPHTGLGFSNYAAIGRNIRTVWSISSQPCPVSHFAVMSSELARRCIEIGSRPGDTVLDPFAGVCTVGVVAEQLGRDFVGVELSEEYAQLGRERMARNRENLGTLTADDAEEVDGHVQLGLL